MTLYGGLSALGALIGAGGTAAIFFTLGIGWIALAVAAGVVLLGYILAAATTNASPKFSEFWRGLLIGFNAGSNGFLVYWLLEMFAPMGVAIGVGAGLGVINFLCSIPKLTQSEFWQGVTGWFNWVFPMSWPIVAFGMLFLILSFILALVTGFKVPYLALQKGRVDWPTGTFFVKSGLFANLNAWDTAFNMGNFAFVDKNSSAWHMQHEAGHTLNLAAFGTFFHLFGAFDEIVIRHGNAYSERLAESNDTGTSGNNIPVWA